MTAGAAMGGICLAAGRTVTLVWIKRIWRCMESDCARRTWTETSEAIRPRASLSERARREACRRVGEDGETVARGGAVRLRLGTIDAWRGKLLAYFDTGGVSNGPTEAMNALIKKVKRVGHGYRNFNNYRLRLLLHCGVDWQTPQPARIRGRLPRLAA
jgi:hypothetical protein